MARDPVLEELRRSMSLTASISRKTSIGLAVADSTVSLEGLEQADIGEPLYVTTRTKVTDCGDRERDALDARLCQQCQTCIC